MSTNTELVAEARSWDFDRVSASPGKARHMIHTLADTLEATEAELTRKWSAQVNSWTDEDLTRNHVAVQAVKAETMGGMHSDSCYPFGHKHGEACEYDCPTCHAQPVATEGAS